MPIEPAGFISELDPNNPDGLDDYATADDHLRLLKAVMQAQFPNFDAQALNVLIEDLHVLIGADAAGLTPAKLAHLVSVTKDLHEEGTFTATLSGMDALTQETISFVRSGHIVSLYNASGNHFLGNSDNAILELSGVPASIRPTTIRDAQTTVIDDSIQKFAVAFVQPDGIVQFFLRPEGTSFTASGQKGLSSSWAIVYALDP